MWMNWQRHNCYSVQIPAERDVWRKIKTRFRCSYPKFNSADSKRPSRSRGIQLFGFRSKIVLDLTNRPFHVLLGKLDVIRFIMSTFHHQERMEETMRFSSISDIKFSRNTERSHLLARPLSYKHKKIKLLNARRINVKPTIQIPSTVYSPRLTLEPL